MMRQYPAPHDSLAPQSAPRSPETRPRRSWQKALTYLSLLSVGAGMGAVGLSLAQPSQMGALSKSSSSTSIAQVDNSTTASIPPMATPTNFVTDVVREVGPAVVRINSSRTVETEQPEMFEDPMFRQFFGSQTPHFPNKQIQRGTGSGFIISENGEILTNAHVVDGADKVTVTLKDGRTLEGRVMGTDPLTDVAVVKIQANNLPTVKLGNSDGLQVGEWAIAIGNPLGLDNTVTTGIISATGRSSAQIGVGDKRVDFIQTDAAINPGNSGGPLLNARGEAIGMNTAIIQNAQGIGFAVPIATAKSIAEQLIANGKADHAYLGIQMIALTPEVKAQLEQEQGMTIARDRGILIAKVVPGSPAARAGIESGDILAAVGGEEAKTPSQVQDTVGKAKIGDELPVTVDRQGKSLSLKVKVGTMPSQRSAEAEDSESP